MAEECPPSDVPIIKEDNAPMDCETSELQSIKADDSSSDKNALTLPVSGATSAAASTPDSEGAIINLEDAGERDVALALPVSGATSAAASTPDSESAANPEEVQIKEGALTLPVTTNATSVSDSESALLSPGDLNVKTGALTLSVSGATTSASISDSGCATSPDVKGEALTLPVSEAASSDVSGSEGVTSPDEKPAKEVADVDPPCPPEPRAEAAAPVSGVADVTQDILSPEKVAEMMSPDKEKVGIFKGVKTAIRTKVKQVWKKLSPKKPEKASLAASAQDESNKEPEPAEKKPYKVVTYVSPTGTGSLLVLNSTASDEVTLDTDLPTSGSEVFLADEGASTATGESSTHASRLPSLGDDPSERSPEHDPPESSHGPGDETTDDGNPEKSS